jgi:TonB-dependent SusC/RagA subfamily outer membrane receptor
VAGANIVAASGRPGTAPAIILRGPQSINASGRGQDPLYIIDGVISQGGLQDINPQDIENIEVVKGAAASSLYGSRAGNGVIQITTRSGKNQSEGVRFRAQVEYGQSDIEREYRYPTTHFMLMDETAQRFCAVVGGVQDCARTIDIYNETYRINDQGGDFALSAQSIRNDGGIALNPGALNSRVLFQANEFPKTFNPIQQLITNGQVVNSTPILTTQTLQNQALTVYNPPYEIIHDVEIARYITPYGIQFDLGPNGFTWIYDVTDYQQYLHGLVDLAAHNTQELIDLKFAFIKGIPPRDVVKREPIWSEFKSYNFGQMAADAVLQAKPVVLSDTADMFKVKTRMSGHGQVGDYACCEWVNNSHQIKVDGVPRFNWSIWDAMVCGDNPNISQGGTWPYAREGWCPGDLVKEFEFELTPYVTPGDTVSLDYAINAVPTTDPGQAGGNYIAAYDLISYGAPNFAYDAAIVDVLNPNNYEYYSKWNPTCQNPRIVIKNTGALPLTSCRIFCWLDYGSNLVFDWTGNLGFLEQAVVEIPVTDMNWWYEQDSSYTFTAWLADINGIVGPDDYNFNSLKTVKYDAPERIDGPFFIWLTTNNKASENSYQLLDHAGTVLFERSNLQNTTQYKDTFDLAPGCYSIIIEDTDHDGLAFWYSAQVEGETSGQMRLRKVGGSYLEFFPGDFGHYHRYDFTVGFTLDVPEVTQQQKISVFPNPGAGMVTIEMKGAIQGAAQLHIRDLTGRELYREKMNATADFAESSIDFSAYPAGTYLIEIETANGTYAQKFIRQ